MTTYLGLLRAINVGGNRKLPMAQLREIFGQAGANDVQTYIQSGNVVFTHAGRSADELSAALEHRIAEATGLDVPVVLRTAAQWDAVVAANPFGAIEPTTLHVLFAKAAPPAHALDGIDRVAFAPETVVVHGRELYLHLPAGMGKAKLPFAIQRAGLETTARNWRTVLALQDLAA